MSFEATCAGYVSGCKADREREVAKLCSDRVNFAVYPGV